MADYIPEEDLDQVSWFVSICGKIAPISSILMFLSPIPTIRQVVRTGTVGDLPLLPYTTMVVSCFVWTVYGILTKETKIWATNLVEFTLSLYYFVEFTNYAPKSSPTFPGSVLWHIKGVLGIGAASLLIVIFFSSRVHTIGDLSVILEIFTFASPLAAVKAVLESQSSEAIPWPFTLAAFGNCFFWGITGLFEMKDVYVSMPAILGMGCATLQIAIKLYYYNNDHQPHHQHHHLNHEVRTSPVEMPYPVLDKVRKLVLYGTNPMPIPSSYYDNNNNTHDLAFHVGDSNTDYVELGVPLTEQIDGPPSLQPQLSHHQPQQQQHLSHFAQPQPPQQQQHHQQPPFIDPEPLTTTTTTSTTQSPSRIPLPEPLHGTFRSRSASHSSGTPGAGGTHP